ncbi:MAG: hypothetical protein HY689_03885 [Chloroflexi bacterium]|nr:hypothetical protein [Chloroflexota bacterium]
MRCPQCQAKNRRESLDCGACGGRLFAWLGDPFGNLELPAALVRRPGAPAGSAAGFPWGKSLIAGTLLLLLFQVAPGRTLVAAVAIAALLWRWPRMGGCAFTLVLVWMLITVLGYSVFL